MTGILLMYDMRAGYMARIYRQEPNDEEGVTEWRVHCILFTTGGILFSSFVVSDVFHLVVAGLSGMARHVFGGGQMGSGRNERNWSITINCRVYCVSQLAAS
jgi:hypothetical protein